MTYFISTKSNQRYLNLNATSYSEAALKAARQLYGHRTTISVLRVTGTRSLSGYFQAYLPCPTGGASSYGEQFHVTQEAS